MPKARSSDRSLASLSRRRSSPSPPTFSFTPFPPPPRGCRLHLGAPDFGVATVRGAPEEEKYESAESASKQARANGGRAQRCGDAKGVRRSDTLVGISTYDCPGGVHRSAKQSSPDPSRALRALFSQPLLSSSCPLVRKGVTYRDTRESTEGLDISRRSVVAAWFRARFTARERTTYGISVKVPMTLPPSVCFSLSFHPRTRSHLLPLHVCVCVCTPRASTLFTSTILPTIFLSCLLARIRPTSRIYERAEFGRRSFVFARYFR